ncbi:hypothetical protein CE91St41_34000 [Oscillospiraceae bacterium]|nr:hypothetical protein CE91St40_33990 [Oscillospiraceae bacterium]BDF76511.1 hypothetical protein CE91St41_34000 [Oscillospiraceae bacterium]
MTGAMYAAIAGLKAHMNKLNVIGNNTANVNTYGYKASSASFKESLYTTIRAGSDGTGQVGGNNPSQMGYGCNVGSIITDMSTGPTIPTGVNLDCMIQGSGFFMVGDKLADGQVADPQNGLLLTRVGQFNFDSQGYLVDQYNNVVYGFVTCSKANADPGICDKDNPQVSTQLVPIRLPLQAKGNDTVLKGTAIFPGVAAGTGLNVYDPGGDTGISTGKTIECNAESISIDPGTGKITATNGADGSLLVVGYLALGSVANPSGVTHTEGPYYRAGEGAGSCSVVSFGDVLNGKNLDNKAAGADGAVPIFGSGSDLLTGFLEGSGTDIATEFSEMITAQRGYQANTRIITVTDSMLEELVNMKR